MKRTILFFVCLMGMTFAFAQNNLQDVVYLKNGSIIRGEIIEMVPGDVVKIMTVDGCVFIYDFADVERFTKEKPKYHGRTAVDKKSPWASGIMSYFVPGLGQFYNGEERKGWIDLGTQVGGFAAFLGGFAILAPFSDIPLQEGPNGELYAPMPDVSDFWANTGIVLMIGGTITIYANWIHSIVDAVRSSKRINAENGYVMYQINDRCAFGMQPSIAYERPQYLQGSKPELSAGMNFKLTF